MSTVLESRPQTATPAPPEAIIRAHQTAVWRFLRSLGASPDVADDVAQDTFVVALSRDRIEPDPAAQRRFLIATAKNLWLRRDRNERRRRELLARESENWFVERDDDAIEGWLDALRGCVDELGKRARRCIELCYVEQASRERAAEALDMKPSGIKTLLQRARATLRDCIERRNRT